MSDSFSFSDDESSGNQKQDWEQAADQAAEQLKQEQEKQQQEKEEAERLAAEQALRNRKRETTNQTVELDEEAIERLELKKREAQNAKLANNFMHDSEDSDEIHERRKQQNKVRRNYDMEEEFLGGGEKPKPAEAAKPSEQPMKLPVSVTDFEKYGDKMIEQIVATHKRENGQGNDALYMAMLKRIVRGVLKPMFVEDAKELSDVCAQVANELIAASKRTTKGRAKKAKNSKPQVNTYQGDPLDDDFM